MSYCIIIGEVGLHLGGFFSLRYKNTLTSSKVVGEFGFCSPLPSLGEELEVRAD